MDSLQLFDGMYIKGRELLSRVEEWKYEMEDCISVYCLVNTYLLTTRNHLLIIDERKSEIVLCCCVAFDDCCKVYC